MVSFPAPAPPAPEPPLDPRRWPFRADLAARFLEGRVAARRFVDGVRYRVTAAVSGMRSRPDPDAPFVSESLFGEPFVVYDQQDGWAWGHNPVDDYVGWLASGDLVADDLGATHRVAVVRTLIHPAPALKSPPTGWLSLNARVTVAGEENGYARLASGGWVFAGHLAGLGPGGAMPAGGAGDLAGQVDPVDIAAGFLGTPYLWGGRSARGIDCSGLVQIARHAAGLAAPRDSDMQAEELGQPVAADVAVAEVALQRGDLVFWPGHVAMMWDSSRVLHATAHGLAVTIEPLAAVAVRADRLNRPRIGRLRRG